MLPWGEYPFPISSFRKAVPLVGVDADDYPKLEVQFPAAWLPYILGALTQLLLQSTWDSTDDELVKLERRRADDLIRLFSEARDATADDAPYWDESDAADTDESVPIGGFPWYEDVSDFIVGAFLATAFTPGAAVEVVTTARKLRLAFRTRDYGAFIKVFINGILQTNVDTYSAVPGIAYFNAELDSDPTHTIRLEHAGIANALATPGVAGYGMEIIRKRIDDEVAMGIKDMRVVLGQIEVQYYDDPLTWTPIPNADFVRHDGSLTTDVTGQFLVMPLTDTPAAIIQRASLGALSDLLSIRDEANTPLIAIGNTGKIKGYPTGMEIQLTATEIRLNAVGLNPPLLAITNGFLVTERPIQFRNGNWEIWNRIGGVSLLQQMRLRARWDNSVVATRRGGWAIDSADVLGTRENISGGTDGENSQIAFHGNVPIIRQPVFGDWQGNDAGKNLMAVLEIYGLIYDGTTLGTPATPDPVADYDALCRIAGYVGQKIHDFLNSWAIEFDDNVAEGENPVGGAFGNVMDAASAVLTADTGFFAWTDDVATVNAFIDQNDNWDTYYTEYANHELWQDTIRASVNGAFPLQNIRCALLSVLVGEYWQAATMINFLNAWDLGTDDDLKPFFAVPLLGITDLTMSQLVTLGATIDDPWGCEDCIPPAVATTISFESSASTSAEGFTTLIPVVLHTSAALTASIQVDLTILGGSAVAADYAVSVGTVTFAIGATNGDSLNFAIALTADAVSETNETLIIGFDITGGASVEAPSGHTITIAVGTWTQDFNLNTANGLQGWTLINGTLGAGGLQDELLNGVPFSQTAWVERVVNILQGTIITAFWYIPCIGGGSRHSIITGFGLSDTTVTGTPCVSGHGWGSGLFETAQIATLVIRCGNQGGSGSFTFIRLSGIGINPFL